MVESTPLFSLNLIDQFLSDFNYGADRKIAFYKELYTKIVGNTSVNNTAMRHIVAGKYEQLSRDYIEKTAP